MASLPPPVLSLVCTRATPPTFLVSFSTLDTDPGSGSTGSTEFQLALFLNGVRPRGTVTSIDVEDSPFSFTPTRSAANEPIDATQWYQVAIASGSDWPPLSSGVPALFAPATLVSVAYDGGAVTAAWVNPTSGIQTNGARLFIASGGTTYTFDLPGTEGIASTGGIPLAPGATVWVAPLISQAVPPPQPFTPPPPPPPPARSAPAPPQSIYPAVSLGPAGTAVAIETAVYSVAAVDTSVAAGGTTCTIDVGPAGTTGTFDVLLTANGALVQTFAGLTQSGPGGIVLNTFATPPTPGVLYALAVRSVKAAAVKSTGPVGPAAGMLIAQPLLQSVELLTPTQLAFSTGVPPFPYASGVQVAAGATTTLAPASGSVATSGITVTAPQTVTFRAALALPGGGLSLGPAATLTLLPSPTQGQVALVGDTVQASWDAVAGAEGYLLEVVAGATVVASAPCTGTSGTVTLASTAAGPYAARVRTVAGVGTGLPSQEVPLVTAAPAVTAVSTDPVSGDTAVEWTPVAGATYLVQVTTNGAAVTTPSATAGTNLGPLPPNAAVTLSVAAVAADGASTTITGPFGAPVALPTAQPSGVTVACDGVAAAVAWNAVPAATGYVVSIYAARAATPPVTAFAPASATSASVPAAELDADETWSVVVQARVEGWAGPPSPPVPLFTPGWFVFTPPPPATTTLPALFPATTLALGPEPIELALPPLFPTDHTLDNDWFGLEQAGSGALPCTLTLKPKTFDFSSGEPVRGALRDAYVAGLTAVQNAGATPWGISVLQQAVSRAMPQTFAETLYYAYGLDLAAGCADLRPGMVLRVVVNDYLDLGANVVSPWQNGFVGGSVLDYDVGSYLQAGSWRVGFDAFLAQFAAASALIVGAPPSDPLAHTEAGIAEAADLFYPAFRAPFYRLFFPDKLADPSGTGSVVTTDNFTLAAADTFTALTNSTALPSASSTVAYFRGRAVVKLCIRVFVDGVEDVVPIGTTVGNVLERYAAQVPGAPVAFGGVSLQRARGLVVTDAAAPYDAAQTYPVNLSWKGLATYGSPWSTALSLPLLHGDRLTIGG